MATVELIDLVKVYAPGMEPTVKGVNCVIEDGEFFILLGPSGCGKSTLLRMIAGLEGVSDGLLRIGARVVNDVPPKDRDIAMVFQSYALYPHLSVRDNLAFGLRMRGTPRGEIERRIEAVAPVLGLEPLLERLPKALSGGQRQRVALGRAIVREPAVFLLDEPLSNLDAKLRGTMRVELKRLHQRLGVTMIYVTHDQVEAMTLGDRVAVMDEGRIQQVGPPMEVYDRPVNRIVAGFLGSPAMNFLRGTLTERGTLRLDGAPGEGASAPAPEVEVNPRLAATLSPGASLEAGARPEDVVLVAGHDGTGIPGRVAVIEPLGAETVVTVDTAQGALVARVTEGPVPRPGAEVRCRPDPARLHLFDGRTGVRLAPPDEVAASPGSASPTASAAAGPLETQQAAGDLGPGPVPAPEGSALADVALAAAAPAASAPAATVAPSGGDEGDAGDASRPGPDGAVESPRPAAGEADPAESGMADPPEAGDAGGGTSAASAGAGQAGPQARS